MKLTDNMKGRILQALRNKDLKQVELASYMGLGKAWVTKLLKDGKDGGLKTLSDDQREKLEEFLGIQLVAITEKRQVVSGTAAKLSELSDDDPALSAVLEDLLHYLADEAAKKRRKRKRKAD